MNSDQIQKILGWYTICLIQINMVKNNADQEIMNICENLQIV
jgi:hypothetical protein